MNKTSKPKISLDFWLTAFATVVAVGLTVLLLKFDKWFLEPRIKNQESREVMGQVTDRKSSPKRRYAGSFSYFDLKIRENIHLGDTIFVDANSSLEFKILKGSTLRLGPMTLVLVDRDNNQIQLILNNGEIEGSIGENDKISFDINEESLEVEGNKGAQFKITKSDLNQSTISGSKGKVKLHYRDQIFDISNSKINLNDPKSTDANAPPPLAQNTALPKAPTLAAPAPPPPPPAQPISNELANIDDVPLDIPIPYPPNRQLYLIKKAAAIIIMPRRKCNEDCTVTLSKGNELVGKWTFQKLKPPLVKLNFTIKDLGHFVMILHDGTDQETEFDVAAFSSKVFEEAVKSGISVELLE